MRFSLYICLMLIISEKSVYSEKMRFSLKASGNEFPPFLYTIDKEPTGLGYDIINKITKKLQYNLKFSVFPKDRSETIQETQDGFYAFYFPLTATPKRERFFYFSKPIFIMKSYFYRRKNAHFVIKNISDFKKYSFAIIKGQEYPKELQSLIDQEKLTIYYIRGKNPDLQGLLQVALKQVDLYPCLVESCELVIKNNKNIFPELERVEVTGEQIGEDYTARMAFPKNKEQSKQLRDKYDLLIQDFIGREEHKFILQKYGMNIEWL